MVKKTKKKPAAKKAAEPPQGNDRGVVFVTEGPRPGAMVRRQPPVPRRAARKR